MPEITELNKQVQSVIQSTESQLQAIDSSPFSPNAFSLLRLKIAEYISDLVNESTKVSKRHRADIVSAAHVELASDYLVSSTGKRLFKHLGTIGGILFGAALSTVLSMIVAGQFTASGTIVSVVLAVIGAFLIAFQIAKD
jgi:hypothetical protein